MKYELLLWAAVIFPLSAFGQTTVTNVFTDGETASAEQVNQNFQDLADAIDKRPVLGVNFCQTISSATQTTVNCPAATVMTGGGFAFLDDQGGLVNGAAAASRPTGNGWECLPVSTATGNLTCYARCCGGEAPDLGFGSYCNSNYCLQTDDPYYAQNVAYAMTLSEGEFRKFPIEIDTSFVFPPENIGVVSLTIQWEGAEYHVTNVDGDCYQSSGSAFDCKTEWSNLEAFRAAMLSGELTAKPGPLGILNEFQLTNNQDIAYRIQTWLDQGDVASDAELNVSNFDVYRIEAGTGDREGGSCQEQELDFLTSVAGVLDNEYPRTNVAINTTNLYMSPNGLPLFWWNGSAFRFLVCEDSPVGEYLLNMVARDGKGGKIYLGTVRANVLEARRAGGQVVPR